MTVQAIAPDDNSTAVNQAGQITPEQQRRLAAAVKAEAVPGLLVAGCFAFAFGLILWAGWQSADMGLRDYALFGGLFVVMLLILGALIWRRSKRLQEIRAGRLVRASGHITWQAGSYRAHVPGHTLNLSAFNLGAGTYEFSFLPGSGRVVAAALVARDSPDQARDELRHALALAHHFNSDDLPAYREGRVGNAGRRRLRRTWAPAAWLLLSAVILMAIFVYLVGADVSKDFAPILAFAAGLSGIGSLGAAMGAINPTLDILGGKVASAEGQVQRIVRQTYGRSASTYYYYKLRDRTWSVSPEAYRALVEGAACRVYFLPRSKQLVGIEPVG